MQDDKEIVALRGPNVDCKELLNPPLKVLQSLTSPEGA
jgi:hypothetical protein